ncbi:MAG: hypothetical protein ACLVGL_15690 [Waltera sp.]
MDCHKNKDAILGYIGRVAYKEYQNLLEERIKVELQSGYDENKEKKVLKDFYIQELNEACVLTNIIIQGCVLLCKQDKEDIISIVQQTYSARSARSWKDICSKKISLFGDGRSR